ncbi:hypothetical protein BU16DRAFT_524278 [Lophium mytilinum]|uniref:Uncharacterized protein n=1 Tax=Lophium mytilinum TaxID=390894 RepID=A0A6A6R8S2_9PEZI|nr:hypothetical protein BU16DRAFT_524278 [Lophium mytilinum]
MIPIADNATVVTSVAITPTEAIAPANNFTAVPTTTAPEIMPVRIEEAKCSPSTLCVDAIMYCGEATMRYGGCYDVCTATITTPSCSVTASVSSTTYTSKATKKSKAVKAVCTAGRFCPAW